MKKDFYKLILITDRRNISLNDYLKFIKVCAFAGITSLQLREKNCNFAFLLKFGKELKNILSPLNIPLIINDDIQLALELNADGVHLGQEDGDPNLARKILGASKIIGFSVYSQKHLIKANTLPINYIGVGAVFNTASKDIVATLGISKLKEITFQSQYPTVGIGGINEKNVSAVITTGVNGIAVINAIHSAKNPEKMIKKLLTIVNKNGASYVA